MTQASSLSGKRRISTDSMLILMPKQQYYESNVSKTILTVNVKKKTSLPKLRYTGSEVISWTP